MNKRSRMILAAMFTSGALTLFVSGCKEEGPAEKAGKQIDNAAKDAGKKVNDAADKAKDAVKDATKKP